MDPARASLDAHKVLHGATISPVAGAAAFVAFVDAELPSCEADDTRAMRAWLTQNHVQIDKKTKASDQVVAETRRARTRTAKVFLRDRAADTPFLLDLYSLPWSNRAARLVASCLPAGRIAELLEVCDSPSGRFASLRSARKLRPADNFFADNLVRAMLARENWRLHYKILVEYLQRNQELLLPLMVRLDGPGFVTSFVSESRRRLRETLGASICETEDERICFVYELLPEPKPTFGGLCAEWSCYSYTLPMPTCLARAVCENQVKRVQAWNPNDPWNQYYPDECASRFVSHMHNIKFEDPAAGEEVIRRVVDAMRLNHPEPSEADRAVFDGGSLDNQFAVVVTTGTLLENNGLKDEIKRLRDENERLREENKRLKTQA